MVAQALHVTTSWDDGHPLDFRLAELLQKYGIKGTFYIPRSAESETMTEGAIRQLSTAFEIGAHTLHHVVLTDIPATQANQEITDSRHWVESTTGQPCSMFCFPRGKFRSEHLDMVRNAGYVGGRTVEFLSTNRPSRIKGVFQMPTTIQAEPHNSSAYIRNLTKRRAYGNLWRYLLHSRHLDWSDLAKQMWHTSAGSGGVFHLWGHSWEIEEHGQWQRLEDVLKFLSQNASPDQFMTNSEICRRTSVASDALDAAEHL